MVWLLLCLQVDHLIVGYHRRFLSCNSGTSSTVLYCEVSSLTGALRSTQSCSAVILPVYRLAWIIVSYMTEVSVGWGYNHV
jgi:hypothetical protein